MAERLEWNDPNAPRRWRRFLWPSLAISTVLLVAPQAAFIWMGFHRNIGMGLTSTSLTFENYVTVLTDPFYLHSMWLTFRLALIATSIALVVSFPTAYVLARSRSRWISVLIAALLVSSFITVVIKVLGLSLILGQEGVVNQFLLWLGIIRTPMIMLNNELGVVIGLVQYTLPFLVMILFSVIQTIPYHLEEAAELHGATSLSAFYRILLPLALPGIVSGGLIVFNLDMGAFTSAVLLGGGKVLTLPVLIQSTILLNVDYPRASSLAVVLVGMVCVANLAVALLLRPRRHLAAGVR